MYHLTMKTFLRTVFILALPATLSLAGPATPSEEKAPGDFKDDREKAGYGIGVIYGNQIKSNPNLDVDVDLVVSTMKEVLAGKQMKHTPQQANEAIQSY